MAGGRSSNTLVTLLIVIVVIAGAYYFLYGKDTRTGGQKLGDAVDTLGDTHSLGRASEELKDRSPAEKLGDAIKNKNEELKK